VYKDLKVMKNFSFYMLILFVFLSCGSTEEDNQNPQVINPDLIVLDATVVENGSSAMLNFDVRLSRATDQIVTIDYAIKGLTAQPAVDFTGSNGQVEIPIGQISATISVPVIDDNIKEVDEKISITLNSATNAKIGSATAIGLIVDNDIAEKNADDGYITSRSHYGYQLAWEEEFDNGIDESAFNFEIGDGCPNVCGWGNNELQKYTSDTENAKIENGKLIITATRTGTSNYESARITTKGKKEFRFGRIDIRAKLPFGQGLWPALWMLGANIDQVGWPACGEIDILEHIGNKPKTVYGTAHWGPQNRGFSTYLTGEHTLNKDVSEEFHVFSIVWELNEIVWYVDEIKYHTIRPADMKGEEYRFNQAFFFILNVAVGGNWPGNPDATTTFPQTMEVDYIRVFQP
jgi:beta-glucanase (GH16 family)